MINYRFQTFDISFIIYHFFLSSDDIVKTSNNENVIIKKLDLSSQKSIREFAADILKNERRLDVLIHNAGTAEAKTKVTEDGLELTMATNHFGPFLLTHLLIGTLLTKINHTKKVLNFAFLIRSFKTLNPQPNRSCCLRTLSSRFSQFEPSQPHRHLLPRLSLLRLEIRQYLLYA